MTLLPADIPGDIRRQALDYLHTVLTADKDDGERACRQLLAEGEIGAVIVTAITAGLVDMIEPAKVAEMTANVRRELARLTMRAVPDTGQ